MSLYEILAGAETAPSSSPVEEVDKVVQLTSTFAWASPARVLQIGSTKNKEEVAYFDWKLKKEVINPSKSRNLIEFALNEPKLEESLLTPRQSGGRFDTRVIIREDPSFIPLDALFEDKQVHKELNSLEDFQQPSASTSHIIRKVGANIPVSSPKPSTDTQTSSLSPIFRQAKPQQEVSFLEFLWNSLFYSNPKS